MFNNKLGIAALVIGVGVLVVFYLKKLKKPTDQTSNVPVIPINGTIAEKIAAKYNASIASLSEAEIQRYAGWIDAINTDVANQKSKGTAQATEAMIYNANFLTSLSTPNLKTVVTYWEKARGIKINKSVFYTNPITDGTQTISSFVRRLRDVLNF